MERGAAEEVRGAAEEPSPPEPGRRQVPELVRRQKRRELDARRSKCRIRIGGHLERWCRLKEQLGFALHSQLAQFLLDRYSCHGCSWSPGEPERLQRLVVLSHGHGQECGFVPDIQPPAPGSAAPLVWECVAGHRFSWGGSGVPSSPSCDPPKSAQGCSPSCDPPKSAQGCSPALGRRRSLRRATVGSREVRAEGRARARSLHGEELGDGGDSGGTAPQVPGEPGPVAAAGKSSAFPGDDAEPGAEPREEEEDEDFAEADDLTYTDDLRDENYHPSLGSDSEPQPRQGQPKAHKKPIKEEQPLLEPPLPISGPLEEKSTWVSKLKMRDKILAYEQSKTFQMSRCSSSSPFPSCQQQPQASDKDVAQIGPKRIRKAAKREILLCDFEGCGKIFSNRQYLNHHQKYQHVHQKTFTCSEPTCGKSFNFKKHLKEHEKLHSDKRDYICEFCARSFRTSSNLIIHRRIHTGEKPLQCEICGFTCRQKASLNWHMRKHDADSSYQFPCDLCGKRFEKRDNVTAHKSKSHPGGLGGPLQRQPEPHGPGEPLGLLGHILGPGGDTGRTPLGGGDVGQGPGKPQGQGMAQGGS